MLSAIGEIRERLSLLAESASAMARLTFEKNGVIGEICDRNHVLRRFNSAAIVDCPVFFRTCDT